MPRSNTFPQIGFTTMHPSAMRVDGLALGQELTWINDIDFDEMDWYDRYF